MDSCLGTSHVYEMFRASVISLRSLLVVIIGRYNIPSSVIVYAIALLSMYPNLTAWICILCCATWSTNISSNYS